MAYDATLRLRGSGSGAGSGSGSGGAGVEPYFMAEEVKWLGLIRPFNFGKPTQREAWAITVLALIASGFFWAVALYDTIVDFSPLIIATLLETFIDTASSIIVVLRVSGEDALVSNVGNRLLEARADVAVSVSMMFSAIVFSSFAIQALCDDSPTEITEITFEVVLSLPSAVFYLIMGVAQMFIGWSLGMRSVTQDGVFNLLSAGVSLVALLGSLVNLLTEKVTEMVSPDFNLTKFTEWQQDACSAMGTEAVERVQEVASVDGTPYNISVACGGMQIFPPLISLVTYPHSWVENVLTLLIGLALFSMGLRELFYSTRVLHFKWWKARFWCARASREELDGVLGDLSHYADSIASQKVPLPTESTPLKT